jgi:hypothetical protein
MSIKGLLFYINYTKDSAQYGVCYELKKKNNSVYTLQETYFSIHAMYKF